MSSHPSPTADVPAPDPAASSTAAGSQTGGPLGPLGFLAGMDRAAWAFWVALAAFWLLVFAQLRTEWIVNPTYSYGWAVLPLAGYLFFERWMRRPEPLGSRLHWGFLVVPAVLALAFLPIRVVQEANPDWVKVNWQMLGLVAGVSMAALVMSGGWRYAWHFAFPIAFCFTAVPWPAQFEELSIITLMRWNAGICAELLTLAGHPAFAKGSLVEIAGTVVNVEEACSGIRSLQTAFMVSLFLGEFYRMGLFRRGVLLAASFAVAFVVNIGRTITLTYLAGVHGSETMDKWHDTVGNISMVGCLVALWLLAEAIKTRKPAAAAPASPASATAPAAAGARPPLRPTPVPFPLVFSVALLVWLGFVEVAKEGWYRYHERGRPALADWHIAWPEEEDGFRFIEQNDRTLALLKYNEGRTAVWRDDRGYQWQTYYLRWYPGRVSKFLAMAHYPTVCLPGAGYQLVRELGLREVMIGDVKIPLTGYLFRQGDHDVYMFHAIMEDVPTTTGKLEYRQVSGEERIASVLRGERSLGQRVLGISVVGPMFTSDAEVAVSSLLREIVVESAAPSGLAQP